MKHLTIALLITGAVVGQTTPQTVAEKSGWNRTSTNAEVWEFLGRLAGLPFKTRISVDTLGYSVEGRRLAHVKVSSLSDDPLRVLIIADIHGGEVEGKEIVQVLLREIGYGKHEDILEHAELHIVPVFNPDGNDEINRGNRVNQNGPNGGVGRRTNGQGFDLNRDFVKVESPEARALLKLMNAVDPHLFMDLHTTNGSHHGYHLTYAPSLSVNQDGNIDAYMHEEFMPAVRAWTLKHFGIRCFDYGNTGRRPPRDGRARQWRTFSEATRLAWNYGALRNRLSVLSEAYSYLSFEDRGAATKAFVLGCLHKLVDHRTVIRAFCERADERMKKRGVKFKYDAEFAPSVRGKLLMGSVRRERLEGLGTRLVANEEYEEVDADIMVRFAAKSSVGFPLAWVVKDCPDAVVNALLIHGVEVMRLNRPMKADVETFHVEAASKARAAFQGHRLVSVKGRYEKATQEFPADCMVVMARQRLGRVAAALLEPVSDDGLTTWNFFDDALKGDAEDRVHPVVRVTKIYDVSVRRVRPDAKTYAVDGALSARPGKLKNPVAVDIVCETSGTRVTSGAYEFDYRYEGRVLSWKVGADVASDVDALARLVAASDVTRPLVIRPGPNVIHREVTTVADLARKAGFKTLYLEREPE